MLELCNVHKQYPVGRSLVFGRRKIKAVDGVSLRIAAGETLGLVGESGCGKSTLGRVALLLEQPTSGRVLLDGEELTGLGGSSLRRQRRNMQIVFQDSHSSFDSRFTVSEIVSEPLLNFEKLNEKAVRAKVKQILESVELDETFLDRFPGELSGGQRQRVGIARALALEPRLIVLDEPLSSMDVPVQAQILNLLKKLKLRYGLAYLFISHDLRAVEFLADRIAVMYMGRVLEIMPKKSLYQARHPYTRLLLASIPVNHPRLRKGKRASDPGAADLGVSGTGVSGTGVSGIGASNTGASNTGASNTGASGTNADSVSAEGAETTFTAANYPDNGCVFRYRCPQALERCGKERPELGKITGEHLVACFNLTPAEEVRKWS